MTSPEPYETTRALVWQRLDRPGAEYFELGEHAAGPHLRGSVVLVDDGAPLLVSYVVRCATDWTTREARVTLTRGGIEARVELRADGGRWWRDGTELQEVRGCVDIDLAFTPSTNTLPVRRLALAVGEARDVAAAWVRLPDLSVHRLVQRYTRLAERRYRYESAGGTFVAEVETDDLGLVTRYPPAWERASR